MLLILLFPIKNYARFLKENNSYEDKEYLLDIRHEIDNEKYRMKILSR